MIIPWDNKLIKALSAMTYKIYHRLGYIDMTTTKGFKHKYYGYIAFVPFNQTIKPNVLIKLKLKHTRTIQVWDVGPELSTSHKIIAVE